MSVSRREMPEIDVHDFLSWEECIICAERGKRIVHYYLKDSSGNSTLAVIGTERSIRHMIYHIAHDFVRKCGYEGSSTMYLKWRSRREVVEWLSSLVPDDFSSPDHLSVKDISHVESQRQNAKKNKSWKKQPKLEGSEPSGITNSTVRNQGAKYPPAYPKIKFKVPQGPVCTELTEPEPKQPSSFKMGEKIELLCLDSGIRGCWFRCKILQTSQKLVKVEYEDVVDAESDINLQEWVPAFRVPPPDKLGMRCSGRQTIRPRPSEDSMCSSVSVGAAVDAWWCGGWWEGVVTEADVSENDSLQIYFPGENIFKTLKKQHIRSSRDWVGNTWVEIKPRPDILNCISVGISQTMKSSPVDSSMVSVKDSQMSNGYRSNQFNHSFDKDDKFLKFPN